MFPFSHSHRTNMMQNLCASRSIETVNTDVSKSYLFHQLAWKKLFTAPKIVMPCFNVLHIKSFSWYIATELLIIITQWSMYIDYMYLWAEKENANITNRKQSRYTLLLPPRKKKTYKNKARMANTDHWIYQRRSKHPLLTDHILLESKV